MPVVFLMLCSIDQSGWRSAFSPCFQQWKHLCADLHVKKRKRDVANLDDKVKSVEDISLDEGEIPTDGQSIAAGFALDTNML